MQAESVVGSRCWDWHVGNQPCRRSLSVTSCPNAQPCTATFSTKLPERMLAKYDIVSESCEKIITNVYHNSYVGVGPCQNLNQSCVPAGWCFRNTACMSLQCQDWITEKHEAKRDPASFTKTSSPTFKVSWLASSEGDHTRTEKH